MTLADCLELVKDGRFFGVTFRKRTTGEMREMVCRTGVSSRTKGGSLAFNPRSKGLLLVFDLHKDGYRMIPIEGIKELRIDGERYVVQPTVSPTLEEKNDGEDGTTADRSGERLAPDDSAAPQAPLGSHP